MLLDPRAHLAKEPDPGRLREEALLVRLVERADPVAIGEEEGVVLPSRSGFARPAVDVASRSPARAVSWLTETSREPGERLAHP